MGPGMGLWIREVLTGAAKSQIALCNLGHCKEQLLQPAPARGLVPANFLASTPFNLFEVEGGGWAGKDVGKCTWKTRGGQRWGTAVLSFQGLNAEV